MPRWFLLALIFSASIMESHGVVAAQPPLEEPREVPSAPAAARLRFRRVYAPADRVQDWPRGTTRYVPVEGEDFERLLRAAQELGETSPPAAALTRADYTAQLDDRGTLHGSLAWDVERSGLTPAPLPMAPLSLALKALRWSDSPEPVDLGLADDGANILVAARSGTLTGNWSLRSRRDSDGQLVFRFELPRAALSTVLLTVAPGVVPTASSGLLSLVEHQDGRHVYRWLLGAAEETTLRIPIPAMPAARQPAILMRETTVYNISTRGLDVATTWKLDVPATPVRKLELSLDGGLQLVAARLGETEVPHTSSAGERPDQTRVVLDMPDALTGSDRPLRLSAIGALTPGAVQSLPRIHAESCTWQEGVCTVLIHEPFAVRQLLTHDCRQTKYSLLPEPNRGESFEFQLFSDRSAIDLTVARDSSVAKLSSLTHMSLGEDDAHATIQVVAQALHGRPTLFRADVESDWIIDAVESDTPGELSDWRFETGERIPTLALRLAHPLTTETSLALTIRAHRPAAAEANGNWSAADLQVLHFRDVDLEDRLLTLEAEPGRAIALTGAHSLAGVDPAVLADLSAGLVRASEGRPLYRLGPHDSAFDVRVVNEAPHFSGKIVSTLRVDHQSVVELHAIRCQPADEALTEVKVRFGHKSSSPPSFRLKGEGQAALVARLIEEPDVKHADGETWKVTFTQPLQGACELTIDRTTPFRDEFDVNFATLPDADLLQAQVIIEAAADVGLSIHDSGIAAASLGSEPLAPTTRALYEYTGEEVHARITIRQDETALVPRAAGTAWHRRIESSYDVAGRALHFATWQLRAGGRESVTLTMPTDCTARRIWLNGRLLEHRDEQAIAISLPSDEVTVTLSVEYEAQGPALTNGIDLEPPVISIDWPVVSSDWLLWLPPGFEVQDVGGGRCEQVTPAGSWSQRWFGPLGRATAQDPFDVPRGLARFSVGGKIEQASAAAYFAHLADQARRLPNLASADWGSLFATNSDGATTLTVDAAALAELQIGPRSMIESRGLLPDSRALGDVLENAGLVLLESPAGMLLTSSLTAQLHRAEVQWIEPRRLGILRNGPLLDLLTRDSPDEKRFPTAAAWAQHGWQPTAAEAQLDRMPRFGGSATPYLIHFNMSPPRARLLRPVSRVAWQLAGCVAALASSLCFVRHVKTLLSLLLLTAAVALYVPEFATAIATGSCWGVWLALCWRLLEIRLKPNPREARATTNRSSVQRLASALPMVCVAIGVGVSILAWSSLAAGQQEKKPPIAESAADAEYRVFIPVDEQEQPTRDKYQVPEEFFDRLQQRVASAGGTRAGWLIRSARYHVPILRDASREGYAVGDVRVQYDVVALRPDVVFRLPFLVARPVANLDGREIDLEWDVDEDGFYCRLAEAGTYQLDLPLRTQRGEQSAGAFDLVIPPVTRATAVVHLPEGLPTVEVPSAIGGASASDNGRTMTVDLGPTDRLAVRWTRARQLPTTIFAGEADIWLWLQVQPASVVLHARLDIKGLKEPLAELWLSVDPRLRVLPVVDRSGTVSSIQPVAGDPQSVRVELSRPVTDRATIPVSFLLVGSSGIGQLPLPRIEPQSVRVAKRVLAVSVEPGRVFETHSDESQSSLAVSDFLAHWGGAPAPPQAVVQLAADEEWTLATRPRDLAIVAKQSLSLSFDEHRAQAVFSAQIGPEGRTPSTGYALQHRVQAPKSFEIEEISVVQDGIDRVSRWSRDDEGLITIFLSSAAAGRQQLKLAGHLSLPAGGAFEMPRFSVVSATKRDTTIRLLRTSSVQVTLTGQHDLVEIERSTAADGDPLLGRLVGVYAAAQDDYAGTLQITANRPRVESVLVASFQRVDGRGVAQLDYHGQIEDGALDEVVVELPSGWAGPFEVTPPLPLEVEPALEGLQRLILRPPTTEGMMQFTLRCGFPLESGKPISAPQGAREGEQRATYFALPNSWGKDQLRWNLRGMQPSALPDAVAPSHRPPGSRIVRVGNRDATAWPSLAATTSTSASRAEIQWIIDSDNPNRALARYSLPGPDEVVTYRLRIAEGTEVLELRAGDRPLTPPAQRGAAEITLTPQDGPQTIEVLFAAPAAHKQLVGQVELAAPEFVGVEFDETIWTICAAASTARPEQIEAAGSTSSVGLSRESQRLTSVLGAVDCPAEQAIFSGSVPRVVLHYPASWRSAMRGLWALGLAAVSLGLVLASKGRASPTLPRAPLLVLFGVLVGLLMVAWLRPMWPGVLVVLVSLISASWPTWQRFGQRPETNASIDSALT